MSPRRSRPADTRHAAPAAPGRGAWLDGFAWALPAAFASAVSACRFEQGDILYADKSAYEDWAHRAPQPWLQVLDPPRSARGRSAEGDAGRFGSNWGSPVTVELGGGRAGGAAAATIASTQGRLFTCLWRADLEALEAQAPPAPPLVLADLQRRLESALPHMREALASASGRARARSAKDAPGEPLLFVTGIDLSSDASLAKAEAIWSALAARYGLRAHDASAAECGLPDGAAYHPCLRVRGIVVEASGEDELSAVLKAALYNPGARSESGAEGDAPARADRFSVARHGWLGPLHPAEGAAD